MDIKGTTRVCGLIGNPVGHSVSPAIHNNLAQLTGKDMVYTTFKVEKRRCGICCKRCLQSQYTGT